MTTHPRIVRCRKGGVGAEFTLILPLLLVFLFGIIDVGRAMWTWNRAEKATQMGVRYAVVTDMIPPGLATYSFATDGGLSQGDPVPESAFGGVTCSSAGCTCKATCPPLGTIDDSAFDGVVSRMQGFMPEIAASNVRVDYDYSGLGYAGDPNGPDVAPLVSVSLAGLAFQPLTLIAFQRTLTLPDFRSALTLEDGDGSYSN